jgi:hypothetical protein
MKNLYKIEDELYIISDKEKSSYCIKECPMSGLNIDKCDCPIQGGCSNKVGTIILTTNKLLIKDGVQAIDDEFLEWFVKNPSCEEIEVYKVNGKLFAEPIIPKEEPKQETLEEAKKKFAYAHKKEGDTAYEFGRDMYSFDKGAKWQIEQDKNKYSEEEVRELLIECCGEVSCEDGTLLGKTPDDLANWIDIKLKKK